MYLLVTHDMHESLDIEKTGKSLWVTWPHTQLCSKIALSLLPASIPIAATAEEKEVALHGTDISFSINEPFKYAHLKLRQIFNDSVFTINSNQII